MKKVRICEEFNIVWVTPNVYAIEEHEYRLNIERRNSMHFAFRIRRIGAVLEPILINMKRKQDSIEPLEEHEECCAGCSGYVKPIISPSPSLCVVCNNIKNTGHMTADIFGAVV